MPILFSAVANERRIIVNFASCDGNFVEIADQVLSKIPAQNNKMTYSHGIYLLHYIVEDNHFYFCITDRLCQRSRAFLYLNEIQRRYKSSKEDFTAVLAAEMYRYSEDYSTITIRKGELDELNSIGVGCSESILGEKILYINNPDNISYSTISYVGKTPEKISTFVVDKTPEVTEEMDNISNIVVDNTPEETEQMDKISTFVVDKSPKEREQMDKISTLVLNNTPKETEQMDKVSIVVDKSPKDIDQMDKLTTFTVSETPEQTEKISISKATSRMYVVIIGVLMVIIGLVVYAFGPISCAVIISIGVFTFLRSLVSNKIKSE